MPGKLWTHEEERLLRQLWESGLHDAKLLAEKLPDRSKGAVYEKLRRMGLRVVVNGKKNQVTTTPVTLGNGLWTHEKVLQVLVGALEKVGESGLDKLEIMRLRALIAAAKTYDSILEKFERWVEIENQLLELTEKVVQIEKVQKKNAG